MATDDFEPLRGPPLMREQDAELLENVAQRLARGEPWDTLGFSCTLKDRHEELGGRLKVKGTNRHGGLPC